MRKFYIKVELMHKILSFVKMFCLNQVILILFLLFFYQTTFFFLVISISRFLVIICIGSNALPSKYLRELCSSIDFSIKGSLFHTLSSLWERRARNTHWISFGGPFVPPSFFERREIDRKAPPFVSSLNYIQ